jgi:hypothetical protein
VGFAALLSFEAIAKAIHAQAFLKENLHRQPCASVWWSILTPGLAEDLDSREATVGRLKPALLEQKTGQVLEWSKLFKPFRFC